MIDAYGDGRFRIGGQIHTGSILLAPDRVLPWGTTTLTAFSPQQIFDQISPLLMPAGKRPEILLLGCGARIEMIPPALRVLFKDRGVSLEPMDTGAACRTYNVLAGEDRLVAAALIAV